MYYDKKSQRFAGKRLLFIAGVLIQGEKSERKALAVLLGASDSTTRRYLVAMSPVRLKKISVLIWRRMKEYGARDIPGPEPVDMIGDWITNGSKHARTFEEDCAIASTFALRIMDPALADASEANTRKLLEAKFTR